MPTSRGALIATLCCLAIFAWLHSGWDGWTDRGVYFGQKTDYYSELARGFRSGHLYLAVTPDPRLESPDPEVRNSAQTLLDASYYRGHYYLTYGPAPAVFFLLPYHLLVGGDLDPRVEVLGYVVLGFLFARALWLRLARDFFPGLGPAAAFVSVLALGLASGTPLLLTRAMFYELAVAGGYAGVMAALYFADLGVRGPAPRWWPFAAASLAAGFAVACRTDLLLALPAVGTAVGLRVWRDRATHRWPASLWRLGLAGVLPAAAVGLGLGIYNYERFGSPLDFGFNHAVNAFFSTGNPLLRFSFLWTNLRWDYFTWPTIVPYFPFVLPEAASFRPPQYTGAEQIHGECWAFLLIAFGALSWLGTGRRRLPGGMRAILTVAAVAFLGPFLVLGCMGVRADRYLVDFHPALLLIGVAWASLTPAQLSGRAARVAWLGAYAVLGLSAALFNVLGGVEQFQYFENTRQHEFAFWARLSSYPSEWAYRLGWFQYGPVQMTVSFPDNVKEVRLEPIITMGTADHTDGLYVALYPERRIQFWAEHFGYGGPKSEVLPIVPGRLYKLYVDMGAFYPPLYSRYFARWPGARAAEIVKNRFEVALDDTVKLETHMRCYDAPPWSLELGRNDVSYTGFRRAFSGQITGLERLPAELKVDYLDRDGVWRLHLAVPTERNKDHYPILVYGPTGSGVLIYLENGGNGQFQLAYDVWGYGGKESRPFRFDDRSDHTVDILFGSLVLAHPWPAPWRLPAGALAALKGKVMVWLDGELKLDSPLRANVRPDEEFVDFGRNFEGFSTAKADFPGEIIPESLSAAAKHDLLESALAPAPGK